MNYQIIFFDLDGTLINGGDSIPKSVQYTLSKFGIKTDFKDLTHFIGPPLHESLKKYYGFTEEQTKTAANYYREHFLEKSIKELTLYEGVRDLLEKLKEKNKILNIVSTKFKISAEKIINEHDIAKYFDNIIATLPDESNASKPVLVKEALSLYPEYTKDSFVMVGDTHLDILGAQANDIDSIAVLYGYGSDEKLSKSNPTYTVNTIEDLNNLLTNVHL